MKVRIECEFNFVQDKISFKGRTLKKENIISFHVFILDKCFTLRLTEGNKSGCLDTEEIYFENEEELIGFTNSFLYWFRFGDLPEEEGGE
jgi:hypothetical protein